MSADVDKRWPRDSSCLSAEVVFVGRGEGEEESGALRHQQRLAVSNFSPGLSVVSHSSSALWSQSESAETSCNQTIPWSKY